MASNAPPRFWPFALLQFCRVYNYWPRSNLKTPPPWEKMKGSGFTFNLERDLHPWGCYMVAKLPKEHPLVQVDSTHADPGLEGVFLGWHDTTPSAWMYSVRLQRLMLVKDAVFDHDRDYPFLDLTSIIKPGSLTADQINEMHATDLESGDSEFMEETEAVQSAAATKSAQHNKSEDGGAEQVRGFRDELGSLTEIMQNLKEPLTDVTASTTNRQLRKR
eukprot:1038488-Rhodomonas_salina.1